VSSCRVRRFENIVVVVVLVISIRFRLSFSFFVTTITFTSRGGGSESNLYHRIVTYLWFRLSKLMGVGNRFGYVRTFVSVRLIV